MGADPEMRAAKKIAELVSTHEQLVHFDISNNFFEKEECQLIAEGLCSNHSILGLHVAGNNAEVDALGFMKPTDTLHITSQVLWGRMPVKRSFVSKKLVGISASGKCWICEGWREVSFTWVNTDPTLIDPEPVYLHLSTDDWKGDMMLKEADNTYSVTRMCPPGKVQFFYTILSDNTYLYLSNIVLDETQHLNQGEMVVPNDDLGKSLVYTSA